MDVPKVETSFAIPIPILLITATNQPVTHTHGRGEGGGNGLTDAMLTVSSDQIVPHRNKQKGTSRPSHLTIGSLTSVVK